MHIRFSLGVQMPLWIFPGNVTGGSQLRFVVSSLVNVTLMYFLLKMNTVVRVWNSMPPVRRRISVRWCRFRRVRWIRVLGVPPDHKGLHRHHTCHYSGQIELKQIIKLLCFDNKYCRPGARRTWSMSELNLIKETRWHYWRPCRESSYWHNLPEASRRYPQILNLLTFLYPTLPKKYIFGRIFNVSWNLVSECVVNDVIYMLPPYPPQKTSLSS